jgi:hypothetical protein
MVLSPKYVAMQLCTCTWIEIMTGVGITLYLLLFLHNYSLALVTVAAFGPLVGFHFAIDKLNPGNRGWKRRHGEKMSKEVQAESMKGRVVKIRSLSGQHSWPLPQKNQNTSSSTEIVRAQ